MIRRQLAGILGAAAIVAGSAAALVHAQEPAAPAPEARQGRFGPRGPGGPGGPFGRGGFFGGRGGPGGALSVLRQLDLTDDQRGQVRQVMQSHSDALKAIGERLREAHRAQNDAVTAETFDENAIRTKAADVASVMADAAVLNAKVHTEVFAILTPEQRTRAAEIKAERQARMERFRSQIKQRNQERRQRRAAPEAE